MEKQGLLKPALEKTDHIGRKLPVRLGASADGKRIRRRCRVPGLPAAIKAQQPLIAPKLRVATQGPLT